MDPGRHQDHAQVLYKYKKVTHLSAVKRTQTTPRTGRMLRSRNASSERRTLNKFSN